MVVISSGDKMLTSLAVTVSMIVPRAGIVATRTDLKANKDNQQTK